MPAHLDSLPPRVLPRLLPWLLPVGLVALWELSARAGWLSTRVLPEPWAVVLAFWHLADNGELWQHLGVSTMRALSGLAVGGGLGLLLGLLTGSLRWAETLLDTTLQMVRNIPPLALIPLVILWFGIDESAKLFLVAVGVFFPIYLNTFHGIRSVDAGLIEMARSYGLSGWQLYRQVVLPGALPSILVGLRFSLGLMWVLLIVAETISAQAGIGYMTMNAREFLQTDVVLVGILLYALLGKLADVLARGLELSALRWHPAYQNAKIIIAGPNFGCGSSREHAPWALLDFGIRCVISESFADIFYNNCFKNGILPIKVPKEIIDKLMDDASRGSNAVIEIDLEKQEIKGPDGGSVHFDIDPFRKRCLLEGLDDIGLTMEKKSEIDAFEKKQKDSQPWLHAAE
mgnify:CR=1 FL=1